MNSNDRILARRYARALFQSAGKEGEALRQELAEAVKALRGRLDAFRHPLAGPERKRSLLRAALGGRASALTTKFLELLIAKKRFDLLPAIAADFSRLLDERNGLVRAQVKSAAELAPREAQALQRQLAKFSGKEVALEVRVAPELLAGVVVRLGDWVLDASVQGKLRRLGRELAAA